MTPNTPDVLRPSARALLVARLATALAALAALAACGGNLPAEVRSQADTFPVRANWSATAAPVGTSTVNATLGIKEYLGSRMTTTLALRGAPNTSYQWRIFRGDCATTAVAATNNSATGLLLVATIQSYPDIVVPAGGTATVTPTIAGSLDSLTTYSVRVRVAQTVTNWNGTSPVACGNLQRAAGG